jgi:invasion protein IalB
MVTNTRQQTPQRLQVGVVVFVWLAGANSTKLCAVVPPIRRRNANQNTTTIYVPLGFFVPSNVTLSITR